MYRTIYLVLTLIFTFILIVCQKTENPVESKATFESSSENESVLKKVTDEDLFMPESIPDIVNERALDIALKYNYSNIRILGVDQAEKSSFHVYYFDDNLAGLKAYTLELNEQKKAVLKETEVALPYSDSLPKTATDTKCWTLARIYKGANRTGSAFTFKQQTTTYGWYHKVSEDLTQTLVAGEQIIPEPLIIA